jgi:hypothetical protein
MSSHDNTCAICLCEMTEDENIYTIPECNHKFHTNCALQWYRQTNNTNCPLCRSNPNNLFGVDIGTRNGRIRLWKRLGRRKSCPKEVKKALDRLKQAGENYKHACREWREYKQEHREFMKIFNKLKGARLMKRHLMIRAEREVDSLPNLILVREFSN